MKFPVLPREFVAVLVVVFAVSTAWAGYGVVWQTSFAKTPASSGPTVQYLGSGSYEYTASLRPNTLFNSTTVSGTNVTLFVSITKWINVTFYDVADLWPAAAAGLHEALTVSLTTSAWSQTLAQSTRDNASASTPTLTLTDGFALNVSYVEALTRTIDSELNYSATSFTVRFVSSVSGSVALNGTLVPLDLDSWLNLTFSDALIVPSGAPASAHGSFTGTSGPSDPGNGGALAVAWLELAASVGALLVSLWLLWMGRRTAGPESPPDLDRLIEPYEEVIVRTTRVPEEAKVLPVDGWEDLVKVADTLGRPILRPLGTPDDPLGSDFYVFDGTVAYLYRYPRPDAPSSPARPQASGRPVLESSGALRERLVGQIKVEAERVRSVPLSSAQRKNIDHLVARASRMVSSSGPEEARRAVEELRWVIDRALEDLRHPS